MESFRERIMGSASLTRTMPGGQLHLQMEGNRLLAALGHKGVIECAQNMVRLRTGKSGEVQVLGENLMIEHISREAAIVSGNIFTVQLVNMEDANTKGR